MSKVVAFFAFLLIALNIETSMTFAADTLPACNSVTTDPQIITNNTVLTPKAKFIVGVGEKKYSSYKIEFECGLIKNEQAATITGNNIYVEKSSGGCEFDTSANPVHTLKVKAVTNNGDIDQCRGTYRVIDAKTKCKVIVSADTAGITSNTKLTVGGENLTVDGKFGVFVDNNNIKGGGGILDFPKTPSFSGVPIPAQYMKPGTHQVDIREFGLKPSVEISAKFDPVSLVGFTDPLCSSVYTVGTPDSPGGIITSGQGGSTQKGPFAVGAGQSCDNDKNNPGINTAIGCIHTNPIDLVKDLFKFLTAVGGGIAFLMMLLGAFQMITSAGNPETLKAGQDRFTSAIIGLLFVIFAVLFMQILGVGILGIPGFK